ncbi:MAG: 30S ribosomal protein S1 [Puniceicoccales bacterium]|jgi:small subunit ribosomal protein S1|nr:30S ribosomal protein S1 [Puniceicoccales bacterium]
MTDIMKGLLSQRPINALEPGTIVQGTITEICDNIVKVDIGLKAEGLIPANEFSDINAMGIGQPIEVFLEKLENKDGLPIISFDKAEQQKNWALIIENRPEGSVVAGRVKGKIKGGLIVNIGVDAFLPASQIDTQASRDLDQYIGKTYDFKIVKVNRDRHNVIISRRELMEEERQLKRQSLLSTIKVGDIRRGVVKNVTDYGVFVDLDGIDGLLHVTDMAWKRVSHPTEIVSVGEAIDIMVIGIDEERERVSLGLKQTKPNPWEEAARRYPVGSQVKGKVVNLVHYGAFVELEEGVEGLIHTTEMSWIKRVVKPSEILKVGQEVTASVLGIDKENQKVALSLRQLEENPWTMVPRNYPVGAHIRGVVHNVTAYGAFVGLEDGIDGMIHVSDISWTKHVISPAEVLKVGEEVEAVVLEIDVEQQRISLGIKQLKTDPWEQIEMRFPIGKLVTGAIRKITSYGIFIELEDGIDGLVHISQIGEDHVESIKSMFKVGQEATARVIRVDHEERRIGLSIKAAHYNDHKLEAEVQAMDKLQNDQEMNSLNDIFDQFEKMNASAPESEEK